MKYSGRDSYGFTLIEVLVSVIILSIGILGILNLQSRALLDNQDAYLRSQAILLAYDLSDRIRANPGYWNGLIDPADTTAIDDVLDGAKYTHCNVFDPPDDKPVADPPDKPINCSAEKVAKYDLYRWQEEVKETLPGILPGDLVLTLVDDVNTDATTKDIINIKIEWSRVNQDLQDKLGKASYELEVRP